MVFSSVFSMDSSFFFHRCRLFSCVLRVSILLHGIIIFCSYIMLYNGGFPLFCWLRYAWLVDAPVFSSPLFCFCRLSGFSRASETELVCFFSYFWILKTCLLLSCRFESLFFLFFPVLVVSSLFVVSLTVKGDCDFDLGQVQRNPLLLLFFSSI